MAKQTLNYGTIANDGTGDTLRTAAGKIQSNFDELYQNVASLTAGAFNGDYVSLINKPTIPVDLGDLTNNAGYVLHNCTADIIPDTNEAYDLGSPTHRFKDVYLSGNTLHIGNQTISIASNGKIQLPISTVSLKGVTPSTGVVAMILVRDENNNTNELSNVDIASSTYVDVGNISTELINGVVPPGQTTSGEQFATNPQSTYDASGTVWFEHAFTKIQFIQPIVLLSKNSVVADVSAFSGVGSGNTTDPTFTYTFDANGDLESIEVTGAGDAISGGTILFTSGGQTVFTAFAGIAGIPREEISIADLDGFDLSGFLSLNGFSAGQVLTIDGNGSYTFQNIPGLTFDQNLNTTDSPVFVDLTLSNDLSVANNFTVSGDSTIVGNESISGQLSVTGNVSASSDLAVGGNLAVTGIASITANLNVAGTTTVSDTIVSGTEIAPASNGSANLGTSTERFDVAYVNQTNTEVTSSTGDAGSPQFTTLTLDSDIQVLTSNGAGTEWWQLPAIGTEGQMVRLVADGASTSTKHAINILSWWVWDSVADAWSQSTGNWDPFYTHDGTTESRRGIATVIYTNGAWRTDTQWTI